MIMRYLVLILSIIITLTFVVLPVSAVGISDVDATDPTDLLADYNVEPYVMSYGYLSGGFWVELYLDSFSVCRVYVPAEFAVDSFALDGADQLVNVTNQTIYGFCPEIQGVDNYIGLVRWQPFAGLEAQTEEYDNGRYYYNWYQIGGYNPTMYNIEIFTDDAGTRISFYNLSIVGICVMFICAVILFVSKRR